MKYERIEWVISNLWTYQQDKDLMTPTLEACAAAHEQTLLALLAKVDL